MSKTLLMIVNSPKFFMSHFSHIAEAAKAEGFEVHLASMDGEGVNAIQKAGFKHNKLPMTRSGRGLFSELRTLIAIWWLMWRIKPDVVHLMTIKPVLYGGIAARFAPVRGVLSVVTGLGFVYVSRGVRAKLFQTLINGMYRLAMGHKNQRVLFENPDDRQTLCETGIVIPEKTDLVRGAGVDLREYACIPEKNGIPKVCLAARLLKDKGVVEFVEAARILNSKGVPAIFQLIGEPDPDNPASISKTELQRWAQEGIVQLLGFRSDIAGLFAEANVIALPSYREGLPKVLLEAAACGRAVVTTDVPGCRHAIEPGLTGLLVPVRDAEGLAQAIETLLNNPEKRACMGKAGRKLAEKDFSLETISEHYLALYDKLEGAH